MYVLVSLLPEHYKCRLIFYRNVRDDFMSCKIFKTGNTRLPATVCLNTGVARNVKLTTIHFTSHFPDLCHIPWHFQFFQTSYHTTTTTVLRPCFRDHPDEPVPELLDSVVQGEINRGRHTDHPAGRHSIRTNQCPPPPSSPFFFTGRMPFLPTNQQATFQTSCHRAVTHLSNKCSRSVCRVSDTLKMWSIVLLMH